MTLRAALVLLIVSAAVPTAASDGSVEPRAPAYRLDQWTPSDGLPSWQVRDLAEGPDGYLWIATPAGLVRFDGLDMHVFDRRSVPGLPTNRVQSIYHSRDGETWFGGADFLLRLLPGGRVEPVARVEGLVHAVAEDSAGRIWLYSGEGRIGYLEDGAYRVATDEVAEGFLLDRDGELWLRDADGELSRVEGDRREPTGLRQIVPRSPLWVLHRQLLGESEHGPPLATAIVGGRVEARDREGRLVATWPASADADPWVVDRDGNLWVGRPGAVEAYRGASPEPRFRQELGDGVTVTEILEDHEGNLWIGTRARGVFRLRRKFIEAYTADRTQLFREFLTAEDGSLLVVASGGLYRVGPDGLEPYRLADGARPVGRHVDARGVVWHVIDGRLVGGPDGETSIPLPTSAWLRFVNTPDEADGFWLASSVGLFRVEPYSSEPRIERRFADRVHSAVLLHVDARGRLWIATPDAVLRLAGTVPGTIETVPGLEAVEVRAFLEDPDGTLWLGSVNHGLLRFREGRAANVDSTNGLAEDGVFALLDDGEGRFWMSGNRGVHRAERAEVEACLDGELPRIRSAHFGSDSGPINPEEGGNLGAVDRHGVLWFSNHEGVIRVDPRIADDLTYQPPIVHIERIDVDGRRLDIEGSSGAVLEPSRRGFEVEFTGISLRDGDNVRFEVRLDPLDSGWVSVGGNRHVRYAKLSPGRYTFRVRAFSGAGVSSDDEAVLPITLRPALWETHWFRGGALAAVALLGFVLLRVRFREHRRRELELDRKVRERTEGLARERDRAARALEEVERTNRIVEAQARELEELDAAKSRFFANVSHEFRTPLTLIMGPLDDVADGMHGDLPERARQQIEVAGDNARRLLRLVNQLLDTARLEAGRLRLQAREEPLAGLVRRIAEPFRPLAVRNDIEFVVDTADESLRVWLDAEQFEKILDNLLSNAFKFTERGGRIELAVIVGEGEVTISVSDDGAGIPDDELPRVFDRFYQTSGGASSLQTGTGIGLALARDLVELHHGRISASNRPVEGATFRVVLPLGDAHLSDEEKARPDAGTLQRRLREARDQDRSRRPAHDDRPASEQVADAAPGPDDDDDRTTVLIVDDNDGLRRYLRERLGATYRVMQAADGRQALDAIAERTPDLIVSDLMMPEMDGLELCRRIKQDRELDFVPVILLTARASVESRIAGLETGADDYVAKPFEARELIARIENLIASRKRLKARLAEGETSTVLARPDASSDDRELDAVHRAIDEHCSDEDFGIDELARALGVSRRTLYRRVEATGRSPAELILERRLDRAALLLARGEGNVSDVAYAVGFRSVSHFSRRFRERHGTTPSQAREPRRP